MDKAQSPGNDVPISALIADDEELARSLVRSLVRRDPDLQLVGECADGANALHMINTLRPDLVFLDVQMPVLSGLTVIRQLAENEYVPYVILVTAHDNYAVQAFELDVLDYLVKPIEKKRFGDAVRRAKQAIREQVMLDLTRRLVQLGNAGRQNIDQHENAQDIVVKKGDEILQLSTRDIVWIEAANQYVHVHTKTGSYTISESLGQYAKKITDPGIVRIHRSAMVNCGYIASLSRQRNGTHLLRLVTGKELAIARSRASLIPSLLRRMRLAGMHA